MRTDFYLIEWQHLIKAGNLKVVFAERTAECGVKDFSSGPNEYNMKRVQIII